MNNPPPGYDDHTVIPQERLKRIVGHIHGQLVNLESVFRQTPRSEFHVDKSFDADLNRLLISADEIGVRHSELVEQLIEDYEAFRHSPDEAKLGILFGDVKKLALFLEG